MSPARVEHIGILVEDVEQAIKFYHQQFGFNLKEVVLIESKGIKIGYLEAENIGVELIQYIESKDSDNSNKSARKVMGGNMGCNHIAIKVPDVDEAVSHGESSGLITESGFPMQGLHSKRRKQHMTRL